jgi:hypothetical protein
MDPTGGARTRPRWRWIVGVFAAVMPAAVVASACVSPTPLTFVVNTNADAPDVDPGDGLCAAADGTCTMRAAVDEANAHPGQDTITIAPGIDPTLSIGGDLEDANATGDLDVHESLVIDGGGATLDGASLDRVIDVHAGNLIVHDLTITDGYLLDESPSQHGNGAAIDQEGAGAVIVTDSTFANNAVIASGGAIAAPGGGAILVDHSTFATNRAFLGTGGAISGALVGVANSTITTSTSTEGGAIYGTDVSLSTSTVTGNSVGPAGAFPGNRFGVFAGGGIFAAQSLIIDHSTVADNTAFTDVATQTALAGGVDVTRSATVTASTITGNAFANVTASSALVERSTITGTGFGVDSPTVTLGATIVTGAPACFTPAPAGSPPVSPVVTSDGNNLAGDTSCSLHGAGDQSGVDPLLGSLDENGGPTRTLLPQAGSPAIDVIPPGTTGLCDSSSPTDQRGLPRPSGPRCDVGAVEVQA